MNENVDLGKILDGCPEGTKFFSSIYGDVLFLRVTELKQIVVCNTNGTDFSIRKDGKVYDYKGAECTLFPSKDQREWSKFERFWDKPKMERFNPKTLQPFDRVLVRYNDDDKWDCDLFSYYDGGQSYPYVCVSKLWSHCIPYNNETKHLVGTTDDCPEYYKCWEE